MVQMRKPERHLPYFAVLEAARLPGCMFCRLISDGTRRYLEHLLYESVNDSGFRERWRVSRGFCHRHAWMLATSQDPLGLAILYLDLAESFGEQLLAEPAGVKCPLCESEFQALQANVDVVVQHWDEAELKDAIRASEGLCGPHLRTLSRQVRQADVRRLFSDRSTSALTRIAGDLRALIESFDYRHPSATDEQIKFAWRRAIEKVVGHRDVPGLQVTR